MSDIADRLQYRSVMSERPALPDRAGQEADQDAQLVAAALICGLSNDEITDSITYDGTYIWFAAKGRTLRITVDRA